MCYNRSLYVRLRRDGAAWKLSGTLIAGVNITEGSVKSCLLCAGCRRRAGSANFGWEHTDPSVMLEDVHSARVDAPIVGAKGRLMSETAERLVQYLFALIILLF